MLKFTLRRPLPVISFAVALVVVSLFGATRMGGVRSSLDEGDIAIQALRAPGTSLTQSCREMQFKLEEEVMKFPEVRNNYCAYREAEVATDAMPPNIADIYVLLKPREEWPNPDKLKEDLIEEWKLHSRKCRAVPMNSLNPSNSALMN